MQLTAILIFVLIQISVFAQEHYYFKSNISKEQVLINKDTLIIIDYLKKIRSEFYESEIQASFLIRKKANKIDTLLFEYPKEPNFEIQKDICCPKTYDIQQELYNLEYGENSNDIDSTNFKFSSIIKIEHIDKGIFQVNFEDSEYTGGSHGFSNEQHIHYDYLTKTKFLFQDIFTPKARKLIYSIFLSEFELNEKETDFSDFPDDFVLTNETIEFHCGMYGTLFGFGGNYLGCSLTIPLVNLKKHIIPNSPIERLVK